MREILGHAATIRSTAGLRRARSIAQRVVASFGGSINIECLKNDSESDCCAAVSAASAGGAGQACLPIQSVRCSGAESLCHLERLERVVRAVCEL